MQNPDSLIVFEQSEISIEEAEATTFDLVRKHAEIHTSPLCGNSVWQDRRFLARYMPTLEHYLHYRLIDVSTVKELARRWAPNLLESEWQRKRNIVRWTIFVSRSTSSSSIVSIF